MNLVECIRKHDIKCGDGVEFTSGPDFQRMQVFERKAYRIDGIPCLAPETYEVGTFNVRLRGRIREKWNSREKKTQRQFFVDRFFHYPELAADVGSIDDSIEAGKTVDEAIECLRNEIERFTFFRRYDLVETRRYWLNRDLKRCIVDEGKVVILG
jgi:hypothetical protein